MNKSHVQEHATILTIVRHCNLITKLDHALQILHTQVNNKGRTGSGQSLLGMRLRAEPLSSAYKSARPSTPSYILMPATL